MKLLVDCSFILDGVAIIPDINPFTFFPVFAELVITKQTIESSFELVHRAGSYYILSHGVPHIDNPVSEEICTDPALTVTFFKLQTMSTSCRSRSSVAWKYVCTVHSVDPIHGLVYRRRLVFFYKSLLIV